MNGPSANPAGAAPPHAVLPILAYCGASIMMTVVNKVSIAVTFTSIVIRQLISWLLLATLLLSSSSSRVPTFR